VTGRRADEYVSRVTTTVDHDSSSAASGAGTTESPCAAFDRDRLLARTDRVDLWLTSCSDPDDALLEEYRALMCDDEKSRELRFCFVRDRRRFVVTRALVRSVLSRYAPPAMWRFRLNSYGRPEIANDGQAERALSFNLSHTSELVLMAVTQRQAIGVDIEEVRPAYASCDIAERLFSPQEAAALRATPNLNLKSNGSSRIGR